MQPLNMQEEALLQGKVQDSILKSKVIFMIKVPTFESFNLMGILFFIRDLSVSLLHRLVSSLCEAHPKLNPKPPSTDVKRIVYGR